MTQPSLQLVSISTQVENQLAPIARPRAARHAPSVYLAGLAAGSRRTQRSALDSIAAGLNSGADFWTLPWPNVTFQYVAAMRAHLVDAHAPATARRMLAALKGTLRYAWRLEQMDSETLARCLDVPPIRGQSLPPSRYLSHGEVRALFDALSDDATITGVRDAALFAVLLGAGLRRFEVTALTLDDYDPETGALAVRKGKGEKARVSYLGESGRDALDYWLEWRGARAGALLTPLTRGGRVLRRHMSEQTVYDVGARRAVAARLKPFSPHDLRATFISNLLDAGIDLVTVQKLAGHSAPDTTSRYDRRGERVKQSASDAIHLPFRRPRAE